MPRDLSWRVVDTVDAHDYGIFRTRRMRAAHPDSGDVRTFSVIDVGDWVNVIALTADDHVVTVRQFRHGTQEIALEIPGGGVDPGEDHGAAAARELAEETGYVATRWQYLGVVEPNPAIQGNRCFTWLALDATLAQAPTPDAGEILEVGLVPLAEIAGLIRSGGIRHALVLTAFTHLMLATGGPLTRP